MQPARILQRQRGHLLAEAQHLVLQPTKFHVLGWRQAAGMFFLDEINAVCVLRVRPSRSAPFIACGAGTTQATGCPFNSSTEPLGSTVSPRMNRFTASSWVSRLTCVIVDSDRN
jgi:hypothetical protein